MINMSLMKEDEINKFYSFMKRFSIEKYPMISVEAIDPEIIVN